MKVYVITRGEYSDYHICGLTLDEEKAKIMQRHFSTDWDSAEIEEYDTDEFNPVFEGKSLYSVIFYKNGGILEAKERSLEYYDCTCPVFECRFGENDVRIKVYVFAVSVDDAIKIASEKRAEYLAKKNGL